MFVCVGVCVYIYVCMYVCVYVSTYTLTYRHIYDFFFLKKKIFGSYTFREIILVKFFILEHYIHPLPTRVLFENKTKYDYS